MHQNRYQNPVPWVFSAGNWVYPSKELIVLLSHCAQGRIQNLTGYLDSNQPRDGVVRARSRRTQPGATLAL